MCEAVVDRGAGSHPIPLSGKIGFSFDEVEVFPKSSFSRVVGEETGPGEMGQIVLTEVIRDTPKELQGKSRQASRGLCTDQLR